MTMKCLTDGCLKIYRTRGLCYRCYNKLMKRVHKKEITWREAEDQKLCLTPKPKKAYMNGFGGRY